MQNVAMASEFRYKCEIFENGQWQSVIGAQLPYFIAKTLDESLDSGKMVIGATTRKEPYKPFTAIRFLTSVSRVNALEHNRPTVAPDFSKYKPIYMLISTDNITRNGIYFKHEIELVELSKLLERDVCDTLTFTNSIDRNYVLNNHNAVPTLSVDIERIKDVKLKFNVFNEVGANLILPDVSNVIEAKDLNGLPPIFEPELSRRVIAYNGTNIEDTASPPQRELEIRAGHYYIRYYIHFEYDAPDAAFDVELEWNIIGIVTSPPKKTYNITDVINRILSAGVTRRDGIEIQKYRLATDTAEKYANIAAPEFHITRSNVFEALMQVGAFIHAIPRLVWNEETDKPDTITFDELGSGEEYLLPEYCRMQGFLGGLDAEGYCGSLDSIVENIITTTDAEQGSITEPDYNAFKTLRTEEGTWRISNDTAIFLTDFPIYRILNFEMGYINENQFVGEMIPFVFEEVEYDTLTTSAGDFPYIDNFPYSKQFALKYAQDGTSIKAFAFKSDNALHNAFSWNTIENILYNLGITLTGAAADYKNLAFRITYIPIATSRVKQYKASKDFPLDNSLIFNQSANTVETEFYGEHLKGTIARIGNETTKETYYFRFPTDMPEVGQIYDDKYIVASETQYDQIGITCTMTLTPNYNKLSEFLGLNSNYRLFDVSEKQSVDRYINYSEICEIGDDVPADTDAGITSAGVQTFADTFTQAAGHYPVSVSLTQGLTKDKTPIESLILHASTSSAIGNSLAFTWSYKDNYGAGFKSVFMNSTQNTQALVPYGDVYGELYYLSLRLGANIKTSDWSDQLSSATSPGWSNNLPIFTGEVPQSGIYFDYSGKPLIIQKDSRENIAVTSQLHFVANRRGIVIGTALSHNNLLVTRANAARAARVVFLPYKLNALNGKPDLSGAAFGAMPNISVDAANKKIVIGSVQNRTSQTFKSWALIDPANGTVYLGENTELAPNASTAPIVMTFKSNKN